MEANLLRPGPVAKQYTRPRARMVWLTKLKILSACRGDNPLDATTTNQYTIGGRYGHNRSNFERDLLQRSRRRRWNIPHRPLSLAIRCMARRRSLGTTGLASAM